MHDIRPHIPMIFSQPGSLLYIGARVDACSWLPELCDAGNIVTILEVWEPNVNDLREFGDGRIERIVLGDVREAVLDNYDYIFYWHGPEHLAEHEIEGVLQNLEQKTNRLLALACPFGAYPQGSHEGNIHETHLSYLYPDFFLGLGYTVVTDGNADQAGSEIVAWKVGEG